MYIRISELVTIMPSRPLLIVLLSCGHSTVVSHRLLTLATTMGDSILVSVYVYNMYLAQM